MSEIKIENMTLRDYFAARADVSGVVFDNPAEAAEFIGLGYTPTDEKDLIVVAMKATAKLKYMEADAMLTERNKTKN